MRNFNRDIDGLSVRTRLAGSITPGGTPGRRGFTDVQLSTTPPTAAQSSDEKLPLRGFDLDQQGSSSSSAAAAVRTGSQRHRPGSSRSTVPDLSQSSAIIETVQMSPQSGLTTLHTAPASAPPSRPLCVIDCCCCCAGSILISWLKVPNAFYFTNGLAQLVATLVGSTKLLYAGPG